MGGSSSKPVIPEQDNSTIAESTVADSKPDHTTAHNTAANPASTVSTKVPSVTVVNIKNDASVDPNVKKKAQHAINFFGVSLGAEIKDYKKIVITKTEEESLFIRKGIFDHFLFAEIKPAEREDILLAMEKEIVPVGTNLITQGDPGTHLYLVQCGHFDVLVNGVKVFQYESLGIFGELALLYNCPRAATVVATVESVVWKLDGDTFRFTLASNTEISRIKSKEAVSKVELLKDLNTDQIEKVVSAVHVNHYSENEIIINKGDVGSTFFMITSGKVICSDMGDDQADVELGPDEYFGERALMYNEPRAATVIAATDTSCMTLDRVHFENLIGSLRETLDHNLVVRAFKSVPLLSRIDNKGQTLLIKNLVEKSYKMGDIIIKENDASDSLFIIKHGEVLITNQNEGGRRGSVKIGGFFGEESLGSNTCLSYCTVTARTDVVVFLLSKMVFDSSGVKVSDTPVSKKVSLHKTTVSKAFSSIESLDDLNILHTLGTGTFGRVKMVQSKGNGEVYALKMLRKTQLVAYKQVTNVRNERMLLKLAKHPFVLRLFTTFQDKNCIYFLLELVLGGELFSLIHGSGGLLNSHFSRFYAACIVSGLASLHEKYICYRDLKPENILIDKGGYCKIVDFGFAKIVKENTFTLCGTPEYLAPELVIGKGHNKGADYWALGVLIFEMLCGYSPFHDPKNQDQVTICKNILKNKVEFPPYMEDALAKDLICKLLIKDPNSRYGNMKNGAEDIKKHPWFESINWDDLQNKKIDPNLIPWIPPIRNDLDSSHFDTYDENDDIEEYEEDDEELFKEF